jgi:hypothetical protein
MCVVADAVRCKPVSLLFGLKQGDFLQKTGKRMPTIVTYACLAARSVILLKEDIRE